MKRLSILWPVLLSVLCSLTAALAQPTPVAPARPQDMTNFTGSGRFVTPGALATNNVTVGGLTIGTGASTTTLTGTNGPASGGFPLVYWSQYTDFNTNSLWMRGFYQNGGNTNYGLTASGSYTNQANNRYFTNFGSIWYYFFNATMLMSNNVGLGSSSTWYDTTTATNMPTVATVFTTNAVWGQFVCGGATNLSGITNGAGTLAFSNGAAFLVTSKVGATNQSRTNLWPSP